MHRTSITSIKAPKFMAAVMPFLSVMGAGKGYIDPSGTEAVCCSTQVKG